MYTVTVLKFVKMKCQLKLKTKIIIEGRKIKIDYKNLSLSLIN